MNLSGLFFVPPLTSCGKSTCPRRTGWLPAQGNTTVPSSPRFEMACGEGGVEIRSFNRGWFGILPQSNPGAPNAAVDMSSKKIVLASSNRSPRPCNIDLAWLAKASRDLTLWMDHGRRCHLDRFQEFDQILERRTYFLVSWPVLRLTLRPNGSQNPQSTDCAWPKGLTTDCVRAFVERGMLCRNIQPI